MTIKCSRCDHENRAERRFCGACGDSLGAGCPDCGFPNGAHDRYCGGCGMRLPRRGRTMSPADVPLDVLDPNALGLGSLCGGVSHDDLPPVSAIAEHTKLDSGEFRLMFEL